MSKLLKNLSEFLALPFGWEVVAIEEIIKEGKIGLIRSAKEQSVDEGYPYIRMQHYDLEGNWNFTNLTRVLASPEESKIYEIQEGDVLFNTRNSYELVGKVAIWTLKEAGYLYNNNLLRLRFFDSVLPKWIGYQMMSPAFRSRIELSKSATTSVCAIYSKDLNCQPILLSPLKEQRRIVAKIEALKARTQQVKEALEAIPPLLEQFRQSVLAAAFRGDLTADWREKNLDVEPASVLLERIRDERKKRYEEECKKALAEGRRKLTPFKEVLEPIELSKLTAIPNTWCWERLVNLSNILGGVTKGRKFGSRTTIMLPYLRVANVQDGFLDLTEIKEIEALPEDLEKYHLEYGDLLFTEGGDRDKLGRGTVWRDNIKNCIHQNHVYRARLYYSGISCDYISLATKSDYARAYFFEKASQTVNLASINITSLGNVSLAIPPEEEQKEIVYRVQTLFKAANNIEQQYQQARADLEQLDQSILAKAFRGELVPQDPNDEPASILLERIQAERAEREAEAKTTKKSTGKATGRRSKKVKQQDSESVQLGLPGVE